jgi:hypothetical protein
VSCGKQKSEMRGSDWFPDSDPHSDSLSFSSAIRPKMQTQTQIQHAARRLFGFALLLCRRRCICSMQTLLSDLEVCFQTQLHQICVSFQISSALDDMQTRIALLL